MGSKVQITIQGRSFTIKAVDDGHKLRQIASELDERLNAQTSRARHFDDYSVAIITALNIMSELDELRQRQAEQLSEVDRNLVSIAAAVEALVVEDDDATESGE